MESLIGPVPDSWKLISLAGAVEIVAGPSGSRLSAAAAASGGVPVVSPRDLRDNRIVGSTASAAPEVAADLARYRLAAGDIVCSRTGNLGRQGLVSERQEGWLLGSACFRLRGRATIGMGYLLHYLGNPSVRDWILRNATGSTVPSMSAKVLGSMPVVIPPASVQAMVAEVMGALDEKIDIHRQIVSTTEELRDSLLPTLLLGRRAAT